jgi:hypothetical protein
MSSLPLWDTGRCLEQVNLKVHSAGAATTGTDIDEARAFHFIFPPPQQFSEQSPPLPELRQRELHVEPLIESSARQLQTNFLM